MTVYLIFYKLATNNYGNNGIKYKKKKYFVCEATSSPFWFHVLTFVTLLIRVQKSCYSRSIDEDVTTFYFYYKYAVNSDSDIFNLLAPFSIVRIPSLINPTMVVIAPSALPFSIPSSIPSILASCFSSATYSKCA